MISRLNLKIVGIALLMACVLPSLSFAAVSSLNPTGKNGDGEGRWDPKWSEAFFKCWDKYAAKGENGGAIEKAFQKGLSDVGPGKKWCSASGALEEPYQIKLMMLSTFKSLCVPESGCKPEAVNPHGANEPAIGLLQIGVEDASKKHKCEGPNGQSISSEADLKDPANNICCGIKIATDVAAGQGSNGDKGGSGTKDNSQFATGKNGIMAAFWQPMREGQGGDGAGGSVNNTKNSDGIKEKVNEACEQIAAGGYSGGKQLTAEEFQQAQNGGDTQMASLSGGTR